MSLSAAVVAELVRAGLDGDALIAAIERIEAADRPRSSTERSRAFRERQKADETMQRETLHVAGPRAREEEIKPYSSSEPKGSSSSRSKFRLEHHAEAGARAISVLEQLRDLPDHASSLQKAVAQSLEDDGFDVRLEVAVPNDPDDKRGRIDILAELDDARVAIELDARQPRRRSVLKLRTFDAFRLIGLRGVECDVPEAIDAVIALHVRQGSARGALERVLSPELARAVLEHRDRMRKPLTIHAAKLLAAELEKAPDPNAAADTMIARGWVGFDQKWLESRQSTGPPQRRQSGSTWSDIVTEGFHDPDPDYQASAH